MIFESAMRTNIDARFANRNGVSNAFFFRAFDSAFNDHLREGRGGAREGGRHIFFHPRCDILQKIPLNLQQQKRNSHVGT